MLSGHSLNAFYIPMNMGGGDMESIVNTLKEKMHREDNKKCPSGRVRLSLSLPLCDVLLFPHACPLIQGYDVALVAGDSSLFSLSLTQCSPFTLLHGHYVLTREPHASKQAVERTKNTAPCFPADVFSGHCQ